MECGVMGTSREPYIPSSRNFIDNSIFDDESDVLEGGDKTPNTSRTPATGLQANQES